VIISKRTAKALIKAGKAELAGSDLVPDQNGVIYTIINRLDLCRVDHFRAN